MSGKRNSPRAVVFWDIDGTLIWRTGPHHREALMQSVRRVTGLETTVDGVPLHGMLDPEILSAMMRNAGATPTLIRRAMPEIERRAQAVYVRTCPNLERKVCPGVRRLLNRLGQAGVPMGLVSGNFTRIGWKKVERAGLRRHFQIAAFAGMGKDRAALLRLAIRQARERGWITSRTRISLVGDTPRDVQAAQVNRVQSVAVATGLSTREELVAARPDILVDDLRSLAPEAFLCS
jgi:phosphoglycolate phosphatase